MINTLLAVAFFNNILPPVNDANKKEAKYIHNVQKQEEKEKFERTKSNRKPSGYMTVEEYELLSTPKDRMEIDIEAPKTLTPANMVYVPKYSYKIVKYNNPPGSPEISISQKIYVRRQQNAQGIVSPDFSRLVYPSLYYYPNSGSIACDLFEIKLDDAKSNLDKILTANVMHRNQTPLLSTEKTNDNYYTFRTLTPVDFSTDGNKLLVKEKIGSTKDGIWKTVPHVYDFSTGVSYNLTEIRDAITYYWETHSTLNLNDKRWDIYPLGFDANNPDFIVVNAIAYTGTNPVELGAWKISYKGESPQIIAPKNISTPISINGFKLVKDGVIASDIADREEKVLKKIDKDNAKQKKKEEKAELKELEKSYKAKIKEMNEEFRESQKDYNLRQKINGSTSGNDALGKYKEIKDNLEIKRQLKLKKQKEKELKLLEKNSTGN